MGILHLSIELFFDLLALTMGIILIFRAKDNHQRRYWGIIAAGIGLVMAWENIGWLTVVADTPTYQFTELLNMEKMLKWFALASLVSLFPIVSLRPGYFNHFKILASLLPAIIIITIGLSYLCFGGDITPIDSLTQVIPNLEKLDVRIRMIIFLFTVFLPLFYFILPLFNYQSYRRINKNAYLFIAFLFLFLGVYILFTLRISEFIFNLFGIVAITFTTLFSIQYLRSENPFSNHIEMVCDETINKEESHVKPPPPSPLFSVIETHLKGHHGYTDKNYSLELLAKSLGEKELTISEAIKSGGFTGFREYINHLRLEWFKHLATEYPTKNVKELMFSSGFTSRSTFYRIFSERYGISPSRYIECQTKE